MSNIFLQEVLKKDEFSNKVIPVKSAWKAPRNLIFARKNKKYRFFFIKTLADSKNSRTFASAIENESNLKTMVW